MAATNVTQPNNIWGRSLVDEFNDIYIQKAGDTATGLIKFDAGIEVNADSVVNADFDINGTCYVDDLVVNDSITINGDAEIRGFLRFPYNDSPADPPFSGISFNGTTELQDEPTIYFIKNATAPDELTFFTIPSNDIKYTWTTTGTGSTKKKMAILCSKEQNAPVPHTGTDGWVFAVDKLQCSNAIFKAYDNTCQVEIEAPTQFGGFSSVYVLSTFWQFQILPTISATMPAANDSSTKIPTTAWVQSAISNRPPPAIPQNIELNSVQITPDLIPDPTNYATVGIRNAWNTGAVYGFHGDSSTSLSRTITIYAPSDAVPTPVIPALGVTFEIVFTFWTYNQVATAGAIGCTNCKLILFPNRWTSTWNTVNIYNINNKINGNDYFGMSNPTYAPSGRQYWTYDQSFSGIDGANAYLTGDVDQCNIKFLLPNTGYQYTGSIRCLDSSWANAVNRGFGITG
jgi:hypothetical protein